MVYKLVDSHAHLDELDDLEAAIERAKRNGVTLIIAVGSDYESNSQTLDIAQRHQPYIYPALGFHPWSLETAVVDHNLKFIEENIENIVAIGEIGLDYHKELIKRAGKDLQKQVLNRLLEIARSHSKPVIIHSRYAWRDSFTLVKEARIERAVFHWYSGPANVLREILNQGYFVSATLAADYHEEHRRAIKEAPLESLLLETDSPVVYSQGTEFEHKAEPSDVVRVLHAVARLKGIEPSIVASETAANAVRFFGIPIPR